MKKLDSILDDAVARIWDNKIEVRNVRAEAGEARAASASLSLARAAKELHEGSREYVMAVSYGAGGIYSAVVLKRA
jgi:hypothetical protein